MVNRWHELNKGLKKDIKGVQLPDKNEEYFIYQTLLGSWPFEDQVPDDYQGRIEEYLLKAMREAKVHTDWIAQNGEFEDALLNFARQLLDPEGSFLPAFLPFKNRIAHYGVINALSQSVLKITSPGVPDVYQGGELWDFSLVDPDNRRPVDYALRKQYLSEIEGVGEDRRPGYLQELLALHADGRVKLFTIYHTLQCRNRLPALFAKGGYTPATASGPHADKVVAFLRSNAEGAVLVVAPRFPARLVAEGEWPLGEKVWGDTALALPGELESKTWRDIFTGVRLRPGNRVSLAQLLTRFPVAVLVAE
jgi:(1->4)-alpha-D-glucan 1-alpha-D-glucosylmutase